jgi:hypothetical protein
MKISLFLLFIVLSIYSCQKDKAEYINHESEIFSDNDTLFIGNWEYLYTWSGGGYTGISKKTFDKIPSIHIKQKGNYEKISDGISIQTGKIDTLGYLYSKLLVVFYPDGIKTRTFLPQTLNSLSSDTLIIGSGLNSDMYRDEYYKRIK